MLCRNPPPGLGKWRNMRWGGFCYCYCLATGPRHSCAGAHHAYCPLHHRWGHRRLAVGLTTRPFRRRQKPMQTAPPTNQEHEAGTKNGIAYRTVHGAGTVLLEQTDPYALCVPNFMVRCLSERTPFQTEKDVTARVGKGQFFSFFFRSGVWAVHAQAQGSGKTIVHALNPRWLCPLLV